MADNYEAPTQAITHKETKPQRVEQVVKWLAGMAEKTVLVVPASLAVVALAACGAGEVAQVGPTSPETTAEKTQQEEWIESLSEAARSDYDRLAPDKLAGMSLDQITEEFKLPAERILDEDGDVDHNELMNQNIIRTLRARSITFSGDLLEENGISNSSSATEVRDLEQAFLDAATAGFMQNHLLATGSLTQRFRNTEDMINIGDQPGMEGYPDQPYRLYLLPISGPTVVEAEDEDGGGSEYKVKKVGIEFKERYYDNYPSQAMVQKIGAGYDTPGESGRLEAGINVRTIAIIDDGGNVVFDNTESWVGDNGPTFVGFEPYIGSDGKGGYRDSLTGEVSDVDYKKDR